MSVVEESRRTEVVSVFPNLLVQLGLNQSYLETPFLFTIFCGKKWTSREASGEAVENLLSQ